MSQRPDLDAGPSPAATANARGPRTPPGEAVPSPAVVFSYVRALLRRRWPVVAAVALACGAAGAVVLHQAVDPAFRATGSFEYNAQLQKVKYETQASEISRLLEPEFKALLSDLQQSRLISRALRTEALRPFGLEVNPDLIDYIAGRLEVQRVQKSYEAFVSFEHEQQDFAEIMLTTLLETFAETVQEEEAAAVDYRLERLAGLQAEEAGEVQAIQAELDGLPSQRSAALLRQELARLDERIARLEYQIAPAGEASVGGVGEEPPMRLLQEANELRIQLSEARSKLLENHPRVTQLKDQLAQTENLIRRWRTEGPPAGGVATTDASDAGAAQAVPGEQDAREQQISALTGERDRVAALIDTREDLESRLREARDRLRATEGEIRTQRAERPTEQRIELEPVRVSGGPINASRRERLAGLGAVGGAGFGFLASVGLIALTGGLRTSDEVQMRLGGSRLLGVLPRVPQRLNDPATVRLAWCSLRQIRSQLAASTRGRLGARGHGSAVLITSPAAGSGKTSFAAALAMSFAESGSRTLLIDFDLVGRGLTRLFSVEPAGDPSGTPTRHIVEALELAGSEDHGSDPLDPQTLHRPEEHLHILPAFRVPHEERAMNTQAVERLLQMARQRYDVVVVDTGPVPGSVEAALACNAVDQVVFLVGSGDRSGSLTSAVEFVREISTGPIRFVFNQASPRDRGLLAFSSSISPSGDGPSPAERSRSIRMLVGEHPERN